MSDPVSEVTHFYHFDFGVSLAVREVVPLVDRVIIKESLLIFSPPLLPRRIAKYELEHVSVDDFPKLET